MSMPVLRYTYSRYRSGNLSSPFTVYSGTPESGPELWLNSTTDVRTTAASRSIVFFIGGKYANHHVRFNFSDQVRRSPNPAHIRPHHWLPRFAAPSFLKLRHILYHTVRAVPSGGMWVNVDQHSRILRFPFLAPGASEPKEVPLFGRESVDFL